MGNTHTEDTNAAPPPQTTALTPEQQFCTLDDVIEHWIGDLTWNQFLQFTILAVAWFFDAQQTFISVFTDAQPRWSYNNSTNTRRNEDHSAATLCRIPKDSWTWDSPAYVSIISEWSLQCSGTAITAVLSSSFFLGCVAGGVLLSTLADSWFGRKKMLVLCCLIMSVAGALTAASPNIWVYSALRFVSGFGRAVIGSCALVHASELVGKKWRGKVGVIGFVFFTAGFLSLPLTAFVLRKYSWRLMYLCTCIPCFLYSWLVLFTIHESPRWLFIRGRKKEFAETLKSISPPGRRPMLAEVISDDSGVKQSYGFYSSLNVLFGKKWSRNRLLIVAVAGFGIGMPYFGMPLALGNLSFDLYTSVALNALMELPASLFTFFAIGKLNRRISVIAFSLAAGICSVASVLARLKGLQMGLEMAAFFSACTAFDVLLIYVLELFPTCVRNSALAMVREAVLLGGAICPALVALGRKNGMYSYGVFGGTIMLCGMLVVLLPETKGRNLCDTMEEEESSNKVGYGDV